MSRFRFSSAANIFIVMTLYDFYLLRTVKPIRVYQPMVRDRNWARDNGVLVGGIISFPWPCLRIIFPQYCFIQLAVAGHHDQLRFKSPPLLKILGWSQTSSDPSIPALYLVWKFCQSRLYFLFHINDLALLTFLSRPGVSCVLLIPSVNCSASLPNIFFATHTHTGYITAQWRLGLLCPL
jgi:hypothetical protein